MQSTFTQASLSHIAAVMAPGDLLELPALVQACITTRVETLSVCTLPPDLRLATSREAVALVDVLGQVAPQLHSCRTTLIGRGFYLPDSLNAAFMSSPFAALDLRLALDYACHPSALSASPELPDASVLLLPRHLEPGNLLRWQFARALPLEVDWQRFEPSAFADLLSDRINAPPYLIAAR